MISCYTCKGTNLDECPDCGCDLMPVNEIDSGNDEEVRILGYVCEDEECEFEMGESEHVLVDECNACKSRAKQVSEYKHTAREIFL